MTIKQTLKLARCRCRPSHQEPADCPQYRHSVQSCSGRMPPVDESERTRCLFCGYHDGRHGDDCDNGEQTAEERRASWNTWRNANMPGGE